MRRNNEKYSKIQFAEQLWNHAEQLILSRRNRLHIKKYDELRERTNIKIDYEIRNNYVETLIEETIEFLKTNKERFDPHKIDIFALRKVVRNNELKLDKKKKEETLRKLREKIREIIASYSQHIH